MKTNLHSMIYGMFTEHLLYMPSFLLSTEICSEQNSHGPARRGPCILGWGDIGAQGGEGRARTQLWEAHY